METQIRTPQMVFMQPQRLIVPLFQRPYVWNAENQWEPLWNDIVRVTERVLASPRDKRHPHFLGAVVLQQAQNSTGLMQERTIIDGQQRLTTLQLLLDALHAELVSMQVKPASLRIEPLITNAEAFRTRREDRFKVWPTNRDRQAFNAVMGAEPPLDYSLIGHAGEKVVQAHRFFALRARTWLTLNGLDEIETRANAIETTTRELIQMVVIDLAAEENAQEIFETLNARGAQLTAADLIKNFVFQRLLESGADVERAYDQYWKEFETAFWESEVNLGSLRYPRSSTFLYHWLISRTGENILGREVFSRFKSYADFEAHSNMVGMLRELDRAANVYRSFVLSASQRTGPIDRLGLFGYRTNVLESEAVKPFVLYLLDPEEVQIPDDQVTKALDAIEGWMVRRMLVRASTKDYTKTIADLISQLRKADRATTGDFVEAFLAGQTSSSTYWPDDNEVREALRVLPAYRRITRGRLRMVLEAIEDYLRGWKDGKSGLGGERVARGKLHIEHVMPRKWAMHWPLPESARGESDRDLLIHTIGNLTLLTSRLNTRVSNGPWLGEKGKCHGIAAHDVLLINRELLKTAGEAWTDSLIRARTDELSRLILKIWPVPQGHRSPFSREPAPPRHRIDLSDLVSAGWLQAGQSLYARGRKVADVVTTVLSDGRLDVDGVVYASPSEAAQQVTGHPTNGWWFFLVDRPARRSLRDVRSDYVESFAVDEEEESEDDEDDEE